MIVSPTRAKLSADLRPREGGAQGGDLGHRGADVGAAPGLDLLLEVVAVGRDVGEAPRHGGGALGLEGQELGAELDRRHGPNVPPPARTLYGGRPASPGGGSRTGHGPYLRGWPGSAA